MVLLEDTDNFIGCLKKVCSGSSPIQFQDVQLELFHEHHPLADFLVERLCPLPYILVTSINEVVEMDPLDTPTSEKGFDHSYDGSPMKLSSVSSASSAGLPTEARRSRQIPISIDKARWLISLYNLHVTPGAVCLPLYALCGADDADGVAVLGVRRTPANPPTTDMFIATIKGPLPAKKKFPLPGTLVKDLEFSGLNVVDSHCTATFEVYRSSIQEGSPAAHQGTLRILCDWRTLTQPLQIPFLDADTIVEVHVLPGDVNSAAHSLFRDICLLKAFIKGLEDGTVFWYTAEVEVSVMDRLKQFFARVRQSWEQEETEVVEASVDQLIVAIRPNLDFTEELWNILKDCRCYQDLVDGFHLLTKCLVDGTLQPTIHSTSQSRLAGVIRRSYTDPAELVALGEMAPLELLAEIGLDKVTKDHVHHLVSKELVTAAQLDEFLTVEDTLEERIVTLEKVHHAVDLAVSLDQFLKLPKQAVSYGAREVLKYFRSHDLEKRVYVFKIPVQKKNLNTVISSLQPSEWRAAICSKQTPQNHAVILLTPETPFPHVQHYIPVIDDVTSDADMTGSGYYETRVTHQVICT